MDPFTFVALFASIASGVAVARVIAEYRQSNRELVPIPLRSYRTRR